MIGFYVAILSAAASKMAGAKAIRLGKPRSISETTTK
jgi:hypothetical protein